MNVESDVMIQEVRGGRRGGGGVDPARLGYVFEYPVALRQFCSVEGNRNQVGSNGAMQER